MTIIVSSFLLAGLACSEGSTVEPPPLATNAPTSEPTPPATGVPTSEPTPPGVPTPEPTPLPTQDDTPEFLVNSLGVLAYESGSLIHVAEVLVGDEGISELNQLLEQPVRGSHVAWAPDGKSLAYITENEGSSDIYTMKIDGSEMSLILADQPGASDLSWSPDGTQMVFSSDKGGNLQLYLLNLEDSEITQLTNPPGASYGASWSPDGSKLAFTWETGAPRVNSSGIFPDEIPVCGESSTIPNAVCFLSTGAHRQILNDAFGVQPTWSPDGGEIAYISLFVVGEKEDGLPIFGPEQIAKADVELKNQVSITNNEFRNVDPDWSPDKEKLAFSSRRLIGSNDWWQLYVIDADGTNEIQITNGNQHSVRPAWQPARVFAGQLWLPKWFPEATGPGNNKFSAGNVLIDEDGFLNLRIDSLVKTPRPPGAMGG